MKVTSWITATTFVGMIGLWGVMLTPTVAQVISQVSEQDQAALEEAKRLSQEAFELYQQGKYNDAISSVQKALDIRKRILGENHLDIADSLNSLGLLYQYQGKYDDAESHFQQALAIAQENVGDNDINVADILNNLAVLYTAQARYIEAESFYQKALTITKEQLGENHFLTAISLNNLGELYRTQGRYTEAEPLLKEALEIKKAQPEQNSSSIAITLNNLGGLYESQGRFSEAEESYNKALNIRKAQKNRNPLDIAQSLNNLAGIYILQKKFGDAENNYKEALEIIKENLEKDHPLMAVIFNNLGFLYKSQEKYTEAGDYYKKALEIRSKKLGNNHPDTALLFNNLAGIYKSLQKYVKAEDYQQKALDIYQKSLGYKHTTTAIALGNLASLHYAQNNVSDSIKYLTQAIEVEEYNLAENLIAGDEKQKQDFLNNISETVDTVISLNLQSAPNNPQATQLALKTILERKGRILDISTNSLQILRQRTDDPESQQLLTQLIEVRTQLSNLTFTPVDKFPSPEIYRQVLTDVQTKAKELEDKISRRSAEFRQLSQPITLEAIQQQIPKNSALVEIVSYRPFNAKVTKDSERYGKHRYAVYILFPNGEIKAKDLGEAETIEDSLQQFRGDLLDFNEAKGEPWISVEDIKKPSRELDAKLMQPIRELLGNTNTILLSPDGALNLIPFEALVDENNQYLVQEYQITYLTSGRDLLRLKENFDSESSPLIIANPTYDKKGQSVTLNPPNNTRSVELSEYLQNTSFRPLSGTRTEAEELKKLLPESIVLMKTEATENALKQVKRPDILHLATHGFFRESSPEDNGNPLLRSGLVFAGVKIGESGGDDGVLTALETTALNLVGTQLVVLSACDTGRGDITTGEGVYGLRRALVIAGSESQLFSLWKVNDQATKDLMINYYKRLQKGEGRTEALRKLQLEMIQKNDQYSHPYYWSSFIPSGDWSPMKN